MDKYFLHYAVGPMALKLAVSVGIGMLIGMERKWSHKEAGIRTFSIVSLLGMLSVAVNIQMAMVAMLGVFLLIIAINARSFRTEDSFEITTSAALIVTYMLGVLIGMGHMFTPVAGAIVMTMLLAWKTELNRFAGGLQPSEIRSAIVLGLIGFVIYPLMPDRYIDPWRLFNPSDAWLSVIAISGIAFVNYVFLRVFSTSGLYWGAIFGGLVNSSATVAEISTRANSSGLASKISALCLLTTIAMFVRNLLLVAMFSPPSLPATLLPLVVMSLISLVWLWYDSRQQRHRAVADLPVSTLDTPISAKKVISFGLLFVLIQIGGTLLSRVFGDYGIVATGIFGGLVSSASTTAAAATMASHGQISASIAGSVAIVSSLASAVINMPIIWRTIKDKSIVKQVSIEQLTVIAGGIAVIWLDRALQISEYITHLHFN